jgi:hypothetical protein
MRISSASAACAAILLIGSSIAASAQTPAPPDPGTTTTIPELTLGNTIVQMVRPVGATHVGEALGLATKLSVGTAPFGSSSGGFLIKLDPSTGLQVRTATTFGPAFAERALTSGEGSVSVGVSYLYSNLEHLDDLSLENLQVRSATGTTAANSRSGVANLTLSSKTIVMAARMGVTDKLDLGVYIPFVSLKLNGTSSLVDGTNKTLVYGTGTDLAKGVGDVAGLVKYRFVSFGNDLPDPGGLAVMATLRFPTGDKDNLRGLGVTRTALTFIASSGTGRFRPHANGGFEYWSDGVSVASDNPASTVTAQHQVQYAAGFELEAAPKVTVLLDLIGANILGGGRVGMKPDTTLPSGIASSSSLVALPEGISKLSLAPGLKANIKAKLLFSVNVLIALHDTGLHATVTPMAGLDLTF